MDNVEFLQKLLASLLISAGGEVPLASLPILFENKFGTKLPYDLRNGSLRTFIISECSNVCRVRREANGQLVLRALQLPKMAQSLPGSSEPVSEPIISSQTFNALDSQAFNSSTSPNPSEKQAVAGIRVADKSALTKNSASGFRSKYNVSFTEAIYQDEPYSSQRVAELEKQLREEFAARKLEEPVFEIRSRSSGDRREVFCVVSWRNKKIRSYPGVFATEDGAKANVIKKILKIVDDLVEQNPMPTVDAIGAETLQEETSEDEFPPINVSINENSFIVAKVIDSDMTYPTNGERSSSFETEAENDIDNDDVTYGGVFEDDVDDELEGTDIKSGQVTENPYPTAIPPANKTLQRIDDVEKVDSRNRVAADQLEPCINLELPLSEGYLAHVLDDASMVVQVKGPGLDRLERQTYAYDPQTPVQKIVPLKWYVVRIQEAGGVRFFDRAMCSGETGPIYNSQGFVKLDFLDNGYSDFVDPNEIFELINYDEIDRLPSQGLKIHAIGLTGATPVEELQVKHPPDHSLLFLPAQRSNCFVGNCTLDVPHVYIYDTVSKRVLC